MQPDDPAVIIPICRRCQGHGKEKGGAPCIRCKGACEEPAYYAVVGHRSHEPLSHHYDLDAAITACITRREIAAAKGLVTFGGFAVHNIDAYDLDCPDGLTDAERERVIAAMDEAGVL